MRTRPLPTGSEIGTHRLRRVPIFCLVFDNLVCGNLWHLKIGLGADRFAAIGPYQGQFSRHLVNYIAPAAGLVSNERSFEAKRLHGCRIERSRSLPDRVGGPQSRLF